jgi:hypothetical protein
LENGPEGNCRWINGGPKNLLFCSTHAVFCPKQCGFPRSFLREHDDCSKCHAIHPDNVKEQKKRDAEEAMAAQNAAKKAAKGKK